MTAQLNGIRSEDKNTVEGAKQCINICRLALQRLRARVSSFEFDTKEEEIDFFKKIKPQFQANLIFYLSVYRIEINRPTGSQIMIEKYLIKQFYRLKLFFESHTSFYHYYRGGDTFLDEQYFLREHANNEQGIQPIYIDADVRFTTIYDYQVARIIANDRVSEYLNSSLKSIEGKSFPESRDVKAVLSWSDSKVALAELIYALYASGVFNKSQADIKSISDYLCGVFNVKIGNIYKVFEEIRTRKRNRTSFLDFLRENLVQRMEKDDEQAF